MDTLTSIFGKTRPVNPSHERTKEGVRFNVETVDSLGPPKETTTVSDINFANRFYDERLLDVKVEVSSFRRESNLVGYAFGFAQIALEAFNRHYPLVIRPDDIWLTISHSFAKHVEKNAEALRKNFVQHEGKKQLIVQVDHFVLGQMQPEHWERDVFPDFSRQIRQHIGDHVHGLIAGSFSTTTASDLAAHEITLMAAMKEFFGYRMRTCCGIPYVELHGKEEDWISVRDRAQKLCTLMVPEVGNKWAKDLGPVLDQFVLSYQGNVNHYFWQSMVKKIQHGRGSGAYSTVSGWLTLLYLDLQQHHTSWEEMISQRGPEPSDFPRVVSSAPVTWAYYGNEIPLHFHAGYYGIKQDPTTLALQSCIGWVVSHDPVTGEERRELLQKELNKLKSETQEDSNDWSKKYKISEIEQELEKMK